MTFANPLPWSALGLVLVAAAAVSWLAYSRWALTLPRRVTLALLRFVTLTALIILLMRPVAQTGEADGKDAVVPVLVDTSRSMSIEDAVNGVRRVDHARQIVIDQLTPVLASRYTVDILGFGESLGSVAPEKLSATSRRSDLATALSMVRDRYRDRIVAGIVLLSDGGDTSGAAERAADELPPIFPIGVGAVTPAADREVLSVTAAEQVLDGSRVDLAVSAVAHGHGRSPIEVRLLENGRPIDVRRVTPAAEGVPVRQVFQVTPNRSAPTVYAVSIPPAPGELVPENNSRSVLVQPPTRPRRVLLVEGAPGFEHSFLKRAWATDAGLEVDSVVRKGKNEQGADTFYIQAGRGRGELLTTGYPANREALFAYDALVLANVEAHHLTRAQLDATRIFVGQRGGGLLVLGARSFVRQGLGDSALEEVLPLDLVDRGGGVVPAAATPSGANRVALTAEGETHPIMQLAPTLEDTRKRWDALPSLASTAALGPPRAGASVLAMTSTPGGSPRPLIAVQRYGEGRAMVFAGEASWRWRMMMPANDRAYDTFWKQAVRWLAITASDPLQITVPHAAGPGEALPIRIFARDGAFEPLANASVTVRVTAPDGRSESIQAVPDTSTEGPGHYVANVTPAAGGILKVSADARRGPLPLGSSSASALVGGVDAEMADPRVNPQLLERVAAASGGRVISETQIASLPAILKESVPTALMTRRDMWHTGWSFAAIVVLLAGEWILRRRWGLR